MSHPLCYNRLMIIETDMKNKIKTFNVETEGRYGQLGNYIIEAPTLEIATARAKSANHYIFDISEVQESTQKIEDNFSDMMPTSEEFWYDAQPETYEPSCYDGTYSEM